MHTKTKLARSFSNQYIHADFIQMFVLGSSQRIACFHLFLCSAHSSVTPSICMSSHSIHKPPLWPFSSCLVAPCSTLFSHFNKYLSTAQPSSISPLLLCPWTIWLPLNPVDYHRYHLVNTLFFTSTPVSMLGSKIGQPSICMQFSQL